MRDPDRPKKSWRELDSARDKARSVGPERPRAEDVRASNRHRAALDALFEKGGFGKIIDVMAPAKEIRKEPIVVATEPAPQAASAGEEIPKEDSKAALRKKILEATSREAGSRAFDRYEKLYGLPRDFELLECGLEHIKPEKQVEVLGQLELLLQKEKPRRSRTLQGKLRLLQETSDVPDVASRAARIRALL
jgi:hypothetical protein